MGCGTIVGIDRRLHGSAAGVKTCTMVCLGAVLYSQAAHVLFDATHQGDPVRMPGQIVTGIGFLGAGAILRVGHNVSGLTTAATIWFIGAVGVIIGCGFSLTAIAGTVAVVGLLRLQERLERRIPEPKPPPPTAGA